MSSTATDTSRRDRNDPPSWRSNDEPSTTPQLDRSRKLNSEGLEGLIPRASLLARLGGTFFFGFWPLALLAIGIFAGLWSVRLHHHQRKRMRIRIDHHQTHMY